MKFCVDVQARKKFQHEPRRHPTVPSHRHKMKIKLQTNFRPLFCAFANSSSSLHSHGWNARSWVEVIRHIVRRARSTSSFAQRHSTPTPSWTFWMNSTLIRCFKTFMLYFWVPWNWIRRCEWFYRCRYGRSEWFTFRWTRWMKTSGSS